MWFIEDDHGKILPLCITPSMAMAYILSLPCGERVFGKQHKKLCQGKTQPKHHNKTHLLSALTLTQATTNVMHA
jgi:hypothetical protein